MKLTRNVFFEKAVQLLFEERSHRSCSYQEAITKAEEHFGIEHKQLRELCSPGTNSIIV